MKLQIYRCKRTQRIRVFTGDGTELKNLREFRLIREPDLVAVERLPLSTGAVTPNNGPFSVRMELSVARVELIHKLPKKRKAVA